MNSDVLVLLIDPKVTLATIASNVNQLTGDAVQQLIDDGDLAETMGNHSFIHRPGAMQCKRLMLFNVGGKNSHSTDIKKMLTTLASRCINARAKSVTIALSDVVVDNAEISVQWITTQLVLALHQADYKFNYYKSSSKKPDSLVESISLLVNDNINQYQTGINYGNAMGSGIALTRDLGNHPANICTPTYLRDCALQLAEDSKLLANTLDVSYLDQAMMEAQGMGSLLSVSNGSDQPPYLICMNYKGANDDNAPYALVGKGVTFDTGGISLKPAPSMDEMKYDMCGAATVLGVMKTVVELQLPINVTVVIAAVENMPSGRASRPGDIVTSMSGKTIEILNTDAEGRLILCDALTYTQQQYKPRVMIDVATLTGACVIALGSHASGLYSNHQPLANDLLNAGELIEDRAWQMPLWPEYTTQLKSPFADLANIGGKEAGSVTAACFLSEFCKDSQWAHIDIAGTAWRGGSNKSATGRPTALLCQYLIHQSENI